MTEFIQSFGAILNLFNRKNYVFDIIVSSNEVDTLAGQFTVCRQFTLQLQMAEAEAAKQKLAEAVVVPVAAVLSRAVTLLWRLHFEATLSHFYIIKSLVQE